MNCPICGENTLAKYRPFCSKRCADIDLGRWFKGSYAIPTQERPDMLGDTTKDESEDER